MPKPDREGRALAIQYVRRYARYRAALAEERSAILHSSPAPPDGMPKGSGPGDPTAHRAAALERLERSHRAMVVRAVDRARQEIGADFLDERAARALQKAIWMSCLSGHTYSYEVFEALLPVSRAGFYRRKNAFLMAILEKLETFES